MKIQDVMTRNPRCVTPDTLAREAARLMKDEDVGVVPVVDGDGRQLVGVIPARELTLRIVAEGRSGETMVRDVMSSDSRATCSPDGDLDAVRSLMAEEQLRCIPIVDERG